MKKLSTKLPKVGREKQTAGFLVLTAVLLCLIWGFLGYPLPTETMEFRRLERRYGMGPTQIVLHIPKKMEREHYYVPQRRWIERDGAQFVGMGDGYAVTGVVNCGWMAERSQLCVWPLEEQVGTVKLIPLPMFVQEWRGTGAFHGNSLGIALLDVPEGAAEVEMTVEYKGKHLAQRVTQLAEGGWLVTFPPVNNDDWNYFWSSSGALMGLPYELTVFDRSGAVLHTQSGIVPDHWQ